MVNVLKTRLTSFLLISTMQMERDVPRQPGESKDVVRSFKIAVEPKFIFKFTWDSEWWKKIVRGPLSKFFSNV